MIQFKSVQVVLLASATLGISANAAAETVDFTDNGTFPTTFLIEGNVTVSGSSIIFILNGAGIGIVGGADNTLVDPGETISFAFTNPVSNVITELAFGRFGNTAENALNKVVDTAYMAVHFFKT